MLSFLTENAAVIFGAVTGIVTLASIIAQMTPNQTDNNVVAVLSKIVNFLALNWGNDKKPPA